MSKDSFFTALMIAWSNMRHFQRHCIIVLKAEAEKSSNKETDSKVSFGNGFEPKPVLYMLIPISAAVKIYTFKLV